MKALLSLFILIFFALIGFIGGSAWTYQNITSERALDTIHNSTLIRDALRRRNAVEADKVARLMIEASVEDLSKLKLHDKDTLFERAQLVAIPPDVDAQQSVQDQLSKYYRGNPSGLDNAKLSYLGYEIIGEVSPIEKGAMAVAPARKEDLPKLPADGDKSNLPPGVYRR